MGRDAGRVMGRPRRMVSCTVASAVVTVIPSCFMTQPTANKAREGNEVIRCPLVSQVDAARQHRTNKNALLQEEETSHPCSRKPHALIITNPVFVDVFIDPGPARLPRQGTTDWIAD